MTVTIHCMCRVYVLCINLAIWDGGFIVVLIILPLIYTCTWRQDLCVQLNCLIGWFQILTIPIYIGNIILSFGVPDTVCVILPILMAFIDGRYWWYLYWKPLATENHWPILILMLIPRFWRLLVWSFESMFHHPS